MDGSEEVLGGHKAPNEVYRARRALRVWAVCTWAVEVCGRVPSGSWSWALGSQDDLSGGKAVEEGALDRKSGRCCPISSLVSPCVNQVLD